MFRTKHFFVFFFLWWQNGFLLICIITLCIIEALDLLRWQWSYKIYGCAFLWVAKECAAEIREEDTSFFFFFLIRLDTGPGFNIHTIWQSMAFHVHGVMRFSVKDIPSKYGPRPDVMPRVVIMVRRQGVMTWFLSQVVSFSQDFRIFPWLTSLVATNSDCAGN